MLRPHEQFNHKRVKDVTVGHLLPWNSYTLHEPSITSTEYKGPNPDTTQRSHVALITQLVEHCTGIAKVVGSNPALSLNFFRSFFQ